MPSIVVLWPYDDVLIFLVKLLYYSYSQFKTSDPLPDFIFLCRNYFTSLLMKDNVRLIHLFIDLGKSQQEEREKINRGMMKRR